MNKFLVGLLSVVSLSTFATTDLDLDGAERWEAGATGYRCGAFGDSSVAPLSHQDLNVNFEYLRTDITLDNGLVKATFEQNGTLCSYSALLLADNAASTIKFVKSKAYAVEGNGSCLEGKSLLDEQLADNDYLYWGHPHHVTIMVPTSSASEICGEGATHMGIDFTVSRFLGKR